MENVMEMSFMQVGVPAWYDKMDVMVRDKTKYGTFKNLCECDPFPVLDAAENPDLAVLREAYLFETGKIAKGGEAPSSIKIDGCRYLIIDDLGVVRGAEDTLTRAQGAGYRINNRYCGRIIIDFKFWRMARDGYSPNNSLLWGTWPWVIQVKVLVDLIIRAQELAGMRPVKPGCQIMVYKDTFWDGAEIVCCENLRKDVEGLGEIFGRPILRRDAQGVYQAYMEIWELNGKTIEVPEFGMILHVDKKMDSAIAWCNKFFCKEERLVVGNVTKKDTLRESELVW